jgi:hypothetical protein
MMNKWINLLTAMRRLPPLSQLSGDEERMLFELKLLFERQGALSVADVYDLAQGKSPTTAYRQLMGLKDKGFVTVTLAADDKRKRDVTFTRTALDLFTALG